MFLAGVSASWAAAPDPVASVERLAGDWVKVRAEIARLEQDRQWERGILESTVHALEERAAQLEDVRDNLKAKTAKDLEEFETTEIKNRALMDQLATAEGRLKKLDADLLALRPSLPPRLSLGLEMAFRSLQNAELTPGERMQHTMTVLNRCAQFNRTISCGEETITLPGSDAMKSLEVIYWGTSHGYALDRPAGKVWLGRPASGGWTWEEQPGAAPGVARLIDIYHDKYEPDFVSVPVALSHGREEGKAP
jgi:hypothetical protein